MVEKTWIILDLGCGLTRHVDGKKQMQLAEDFKPVVEMPSDSEDEAHHRTLRFLTRIANGELDRRALKPEMMNILSALPQNSGNIQRQGFAGFLPQLIISAVIRSGFTRRTRSQ